MEEGGGGGSRDGGHKVQSNMRGHRLWRRIFCDGVELSVNARVVGESDMVFCVFAGGSICSYRRDPAADAADEGRRGPGDYGGIREYTCERRGEEETEEPECEVRRQGGDQILLVDS